MAAGNPVREALVAVATRHLGLDADTFLTALVMLLNIVLMPLLYNRLPQHHAGLRNWCSTLLACGTFAVLFQPAGLLQLLGLAIACYYLTLAFAHKPFGPVLVFTVAMGHLAIVLLYAQVFGSAGDASMDHTAPLMVMVMKLSSYAWSCHDGTKPEAQLSPSQRRCAIRFVPGLTDFLGFVFFFPSFLVGPSFEFLDYHQFVRGQGPFDRTRMPSPYPRFWRAMGVALVIAYLHLRFGHLNYHSMVAPGFVESHSFWYRFAYMQVAAFIFRTLYMIAWKLSEAACILSGLSYAGHGEGDRFDRLQNVNIYENEVAENPRAKVAYWNMNTAAWLRKCVYVRIAPEGTSKRTAIASFWTFMISAFWHGFHPGYYYTFVLLGMINYVGRQARKYLRPLFHAPSKLGAFKPLYDVAGIVMTQVLFNYAGAPFILRTNALAIQFYGSFYWCVHLLLGAVIVAAEMRWLDVLFVPVWKRVGAPLPLKKRPAAHAPAKPTSPSSPVVVPGSERVTTALPAPSIASSERQRHLPEGEGKEGAAPAAPSEASNKATDSASDL